MPSGDRTGIGEAASAIGKGLSNLGEGLLSAQEQIEKARQLREKQDMDNAVDMEEIDFAEKTRELKTIGKTKLGGEAKGVYDNFRFSWGTSSEEEFYNRNIYHNAGVTDNKELFYKCDYMNCLPYNVPLHIKSGTASKKYYEWIQEVGKKSILIDR